MDLFDLSKMASSTPYGLGDTCFEKLISFNKNLNALGMILTLENTEIKIVVLTEFNLF